MSNFFKFVFASCLGVFLSMIVVFLISSLVLGRMISTAEAPPTMKPNTVLTLDLNEAIPEKTNNKPVGNFEVNTDDVLGLQDIVKSIEHAKTDDNIKGIFLKLSTTNLGRASSSVVRRALVDFQESGKFIISWSEFYSQGTYHLASAADEVFLLPSGGMDFRGFATQIPFMKDMLDRLGINMQVYYAGQYKSATEPFRRHEMSEQSRLQIREYLEGLYGEYLNDIATSRKMEKTEVRRLANDYLIRTSEDALNYKLVDKLAYYDEVLDALRDRLGLDENDKVRSISLNKYAKVAGSSSGSGRDRIAVVYAEGDIVMGKGDVGNIGGEKYSRIIRKVRQDDKVKAIVLRVNSGGGSGVASDMIWRELEMAKADGIPVMVSMGDVAASGGYYIACNADSIFVEPNTITGSIGVFGMIPSMQKMLKEKAGIAFDSVKTGNYATAMTPFFDASPEEGKVIQSMVDNFYQLFLKRVAEGRGMSIEEVDKVAQGRVWTGVAASSNGLVDAMGDLDDAISAAASKANLDDYKIKEYPVTKNPIQQYFDKFMEQDNSPATSYVLQSELGDFYPYYQQLVSIKNMKGVQARIPFLLEKGW